ncbi:MAG: acyltransferase [Ferruginibacter sp.]|nr:acyltransferase [Cytophagales bacterium]
MKTDQRPVEYVDFARGYAISTIVIFHFFFENIVFGNLLDQAFFFGGAGVHLYFFLSGFGLSLSRNVSPLDFYRRRFSKVILPYLFFVSFAFLLSFYYPVAPVQDWRAYLSHLFLFKMFDNDLIGSFGYQLWFMSTLIQFYLVFPFLFSWKEKIGKGRWLALATGVSLGYFGLVYAAGRSGDSVWVSFFLQFLWEFALGMTLADLYREKDFRFWNLSPVWYAGLAILGMGSMAFLTLKMGDAVKAFNDFPAFLGYTSLSILVFQLTDRYLPWLKRAFAGVGKVSFFLFLTHVLVLKAMVDGLRAYGQGLSAYHLVLYLPLALLIAAGFQYVYLKVASSFNRPVLHPNQS